MKRHIFEFLMITAGVFSLAFAIVAFWEPQSLVTGGVSGLAIVIGDYSSRLGFRVPIWLTNLALNIPLFIVGLKTMNRGFLIRTAYATLLLSLAIYLVGFLPEIPSDRTLAALFGGAFAGFGLGLVFRFMATTGGSDLAAGILHRRALRHFSIAKILFVIDSLIIAIGLLAFGPVAAMYAAVAVFVSTRVTDTVLDGFSFAKAAFIISERANEISEKVLHGMNRGATMLRGQGMYSKSDRNVLLCVVSNKELVSLKQVVHEADANAFVIVADVREVLGEGFGEQSFPMQM